MLDRVRAFTYARQRLGRAAPDAATAVDDVLAVYSSHPSAPLALHARSAAMTGRARGCARRSSGARRRSRRCWPEFS